MPAYATLERPILLHETNGSTNYRLYSRLDRAKACRVALLNEPSWAQVYSKKTGNHSVELVIEMLDRVIADPGAHSRDLAAEFGRSATTFNTILRAAYDAVGV